MSDATRLNLPSALEAAQQLRTSNQDPKGVAHALLALAAERKELLKVVDAVNLYLHSGGGTTEHARLVRALNHWKNWAGQHSGADGPFGL